MTLLHRQRRRSGYHPNAYQFVFAALQHAQDQLGRDRTSMQAGHVSGPELLEGAREIALQHFGLLARTVLNHWGITSTVDFGRIVFELIETGRMRKTDDDRIEDFIDVYDFREVFDDAYQIDTSAAFDEKPAEV